VRTPALGDAVLRLSWLVPRAASLVALARAPAAAWEAIHADPGAVLLVAREAGAARSLPFFFPALLPDPAVLDAALRHLDQPGRPAADPFALDAVRRASLRYAARARHLAERCGRCDPENAWVAGLLAPLGWLAVAALDPVRAAACHDDPAHAAHPADTERRHWGHDQAALARRLARRWRLPDWLAAVTGHLGLPVAVAQQFGADPDLFRVAQLAVALAQEEGESLRLAVGSGPAELGAELGIVDCRLRVADLDGNPQSAIGDLKSPEPVPPGLLRDLLSLAAENRRPREPELVRRLERDVADLHRAREEQRLGEAERLLTQKLRGLAEFAAGAGHEINNPLAVISCQAQYLLQHEAEGSRQRALQTIVQQTQRIHQALRELMQFARPSRPQKQAVDLLAAAQEVAVALGDLAAGRRVELRGPEADGPLPFVNADLGQVRNALTCLVRNALEAAPAGGWACVCLTAGPETVAVAVEDSGPGPSPAQQEHLFDPFFSGRQAGRGRGLGLPIAWRLARENGGTVRFVPLADGPTRFVLTLPRHHEPEAGANGHGSALPVRSLPA
jgi:two-component system NtrC family sensor kinase